MNLTREIGGLGQAPTSTGIIFGRVAACPSCTCLHACTIMGLLLDFRSVCPIAKNIFEI